MVSFIAYHVRGFGMPAHLFLRGMLHHYGVQFHELSLNSVQQMGAFMALYEGFLGSKAHFDLFTYFFLAAVVKSVAGVGPAGFCSIKMKQSRVWGWSCPPPTRTGIGTGSVFGTKTTGGCRRLRPTGTSLKMTCLSGPRARPRKPIIASKITSCASVA